LDEWLGLHRLYTPAVAQLMCWTGAMESSFEHASETLRRCAGLATPGRQIQRVVNDCGPGAARWMDQRPAPRRLVPVEVLNIQTALTGIPARPEELQNIKGRQPDGSAKTRPIKVGCVFTQTLNAQGHPDRNPASTTYLSGFRDLVDLACVCAQKLSNGGRPARPSDRFPRRRSRMDLGHRQRLLSGGHRNRRLLPRLRTSSPPVPDARTGRFPGSNPLRQMAQNPQEKRSGPTPPPSRKTLGLGSQDPLPNPR